MSCWRPDPSERPSFAELVTSLELELPSKEVRNEQSFKLKPRNKKNRNKVNKLMSRE